MSDLGSILQAPTQTINHCLTWMTERGWVSTVLRTDEDDDPIQCYQPGRPLQSICLKDFREAFESIGNNRAIELLKNVHPLVPFYEEHINVYKSESAMNKNIRELLLEHDIELTKALPCEPMAPEDEGD
jgi:hypothetical protein